MTVKIDPIDVQSLSKRYPNGVEAVRELTLKIVMGQIVGLIGPNGSGKTTTINLLTTSFRPTSGTGKILGFDLLRENAQIRKRIGLVPQYESIDWSLTVAQNLMVFAKLLKLSHAAQRVEALLDMLDLAEKRNDSMEELSGGQIRRVQLARAFLFPAQILFVDEPTVGLDPIGVDKVLGFLKDCASHGMTIILASNVMEEIQNACDRLVFINKGRKIFDGSVSCAIQHFRLEERVIIQSKTAVPFNLIANIEQSGLKVLKKDPLTISGVNAGSTLLSLLAPFMGNGYDLASFVVEQPTLRQAFVELASKEAGE